MNVLIAGSSGFVGTALMRLLLKNDVHISRLVRKKTSTTGTPRNSLHLANSQNIEIIEWDPDASYIDIKKLEKIGIDTVVNLAGESAHQRWTAKNKQRIVDSRLRSTSLLVSTSNKLTNPPEVFVSASGISYYNNPALRTAQIEPASKESDDGTSNSSLEASLIDESSGPGSGFLSRLVQEWEAATHVDDKHSNLRIVNLRIGIVLGAEGGVLAKFLPLFKACLGAKWGTGKQYMSWISIDDMASAIYFAIKKNSIAGPVNAVGPNPVTNKEFTETLGKVLSRPAFLTVPSFIANMFFGSEWAESTPLADYRIKPGVLQKHGFDFKYPNLQGFLEGVVKTKPNNSLVN